MTPARRTWILRLLTLAITVSGCLVAAEGVVRVIPLIVPAPPKSDHGDAWEWSASLHHRLLPNIHWRHRSPEFDYIWETNELGMRDQPHERRKPPGTFRVLLLGDSFIQGFGVPLDATLGVLLDSSLNHPARALRIEVMNAAVFAYSPFLERLQLGEWIDTLAPDLVLVGFYLGNDVGEDNYYARRARSDSPGGPVQFSDREWPWAPMTALVDHDPQVVKLAQAVQAPPPARPGAWAAFRRTLGHSELVSLAYHELNRRREETGPLPLDEAYIARRTREHELLQQHRGDITYDLSLVNYPVLTRAARMDYWRTSLQQLAGIDEMCRIRGARMILLVIPPVERLNGESDFDEPYEVLEEFGRNLGVPVINLLSGFQGLPIDSIYYHYDYHWTPAGHRRAAEVVDRELRHLEVLPPASP